MAKPKILIVAYLRGWSYDLTAQALRRELRETHEVRIAYSEDVLVGGVLRDELAEWAEVIVDMWWHGTMHLHYGRRVVKQVSSHRWTLPKWGRLKASHMLEQYATGAGVVVVPSHRLLAELRQVENPEPRVVMLGQKGFSPALFFDQRRRGGPLAVGWAGCADSKDKHVDTLLEVDSQLRVADKCLVYSEMPDFYNDIDVLAVSSQHEGDPRPLIEAMACGCFPVATDVGIVPELILSGHNGIIVEDRTPEHFAAAFAWCRDHIALVREAGRWNARTMLSRRRWSDVAPTWASAFDVALARSQP